jgi:hypothetical protein
MFKPSYFERLVEAVTLIVRHPDEPCKPGVVARCRRELADLSQAGRITAAEAEVLVKILDDGLAPNYVQDSCAGSRG